MAGLLLSVGARIDIRDMYCRTALDHAKSATTSSEVDKQTIVSAIEGLMAQAGGGDEVNEADALRKEGNAAFAMGEYMEAAQVYTRAIKLREDDHRIFSNRAAAHLKVAQDFTSRALGMQMQQASAHNLSITPLCELSEQDKEEHQTQMNMAAQLFAIAKSDSIRVASKCLCLRATHIYTHMQAYAWFCRMAAIVKTMVLSKKFASK